MKFLPVLILTLILPLTMHSQQRLRDHGIELGVLRPGKWNAITDVPGVAVGHTTLVEGDAVRVRPGVPGVDFDGPEVFLLASQPDSSVCGIHVESF